MNEKSSKNEENEIKLKEILDWAAHIAIAIVIAVLIVTFVGQRTIVHEISMEPTLSEGDNLIVEKISSRFGLLKKGDIIIFKSPFDKRELIKRLIAVEGDTVELKDGRVYVNGELFLIGDPEDEPYTPPAANPEDNKITIPEGYVYVLGDNRPYSHDSTEFGPIEKNRITGKAIFRFFPYNKIGKID